MTRQTATQQRPLTPSPLSTGSILQRKCGSCGQHTIAGGTCAECAKKKSGLQRKLTIGASNDPLEQEADRIADQVLAAPAHNAINAAPPRIQRLVGQPTGEADMAAPASVDRVLSSPGSPLEPSLQQDMEQRFGHDFSQVRVHTGAEAGRSARDVNANAYTVGHNVVFGAGRYAPETHGGRRLIAHELTHVVQQNTSLQKKIIQRDGFADAGFADAGVAACTLATPKSCSSYEDWLDKFPPPTPTNGPGGTLDKTVNSSMPADLLNLVTGKLSGSGGLPDCADVALLLRHYYLKAKGQSFSFMVGRNKVTAETFTLGKSTNDKEIRACMIGTGTESFQETRSGFALANFHKDRGKNLLNLKKLLATGLKSGDVFVWKRRAEVAGNFQGHAQTVQVVGLPKTDPKDATKITQEGTITVLQGNMSGGKGVGELQQRVYTFLELTKKQDGDADIVGEPRHDEELFFGAGPWRT